MSSEEERRRIQEVYISWTTRAAGALNSDGSNLKQLLDVLPEPFKADVERALCKIVEGKQKPIST